MFPGFVQSLKTKGNLSYNKKYAFNWQKEVNSFGMNIAIIKVYMTGFFLFARLNLPNVLAV